MPSQPTSLPYTVTNSSMLIKYVKLIEAPIYQAGDTVLYEGEITRVIRHNDCYVFYKYEILLNDKEILVSPFQITKIDY